jgi:FtsP/CotA-like multicopper oxidase with cupredoxin domain
MHPTRRTVTIGLATSLTSVGAATPAWASSAQQSSGQQDSAWRTLTAAPARVRLRPEPAPETEVWAFDGEVPGPVLRVRHGDEVRVRLVNKTERPLSLHWHGVRNVNAMDGVGGLTQPPVAPGASFDYRFTPPDAGTFLIRPLVVGGSSEPAERGLSGLLVVEEREPPAVDQDFALVIDDWRIGDDGALAPFGNPLEGASAGRLGNWLTVNGRGVPHEIKAAPGARIRLRLANACNARAFALRFDDLRPYVAAVDGQPVDAFEPLRSTLPFAPGNRYDLVLDMPSGSGGAGRIMALIGAGAPLVSLVTDGETSRRPPAGAVAGLSPNKLLPPQIRLQNATRKEIVIAGGARVTPGAAPVYTGAPQKIWTINGAAGSASAPPLVRVKRGTPVVLMLRNQTPVPQPIHVHGHSFRLLHVADDGWEPYWLDTLQVPENRTVRIAFVADNPGRWALSSAVLERFDTGLWTWFEVT